MVVYPVEGRRVRCPTTRRPVPAEGLTVLDGDLFWTRRLRDGDVTLDAPRVVQPKPAVEAETSLSAAAEPEEHL